MLRSTIRRIRRTLSFRSKKKKGDGSGAKATNQIWENDAENIKHGGCTFPVKYLGSIEVSESRGTQVCSQAAHQMKMSSTGKKKQRVTLWVTEETLRVTDDDTKCMVVDQVIEKVSFCTPDPHDDKLFSYICRDGTSRRWLCHSFKGIKDSGERISHAVGCAFAACLAKKQAQNQQNLQRGTQARRTLEARPNGVKLPQQSVETLKKLNQDDYDSRVEKVNQSLQETTVITHNTPEVLVAQPTTPSSPSSKQPPPAFARPRPSVGLDAAAFSRHASLPYRTKKSTTTSGSATYQALTEDPLPPRIYHDDPIFSNPDPIVSPKQDPSVSQADLWLTGANQSNSIMGQNNVLVGSNPFTAQQPHPTMVMQQPVFTPVGMSQTGMQQNVNPFAGNVQINNSTMVT